MIARIGTFRRLTPEQRAASEDNLRRRFLPALRAQPGFVAGYWLAGADGTLLSVTIWESVETMEEGGRRANAVPLLPDQVAEAIPSPDAVETFEVTAHA